MQKPSTIALTLSLAAVLAGAALTPTFAQFAAGHAHGQRGGGLKKLANTLGLTDAQKAQLKPILQNTRQQAKAIKDDTTLTPESKKTKLRDLHKASQSQMRAILTPEQREKLQDMRQERRQAKAGNG